MSQFDEDEKVMVPAKMQVQTQSSGGVSPWVSIALGKAKSINWRTYVVGGVFAASMVVYSAQWQKAEAPRKLENPNDVRKIPAFDESKLMASDQAAIDEHERNLSAFLNEERQRSVVALAMAYQGVATQMISTPGHTCNGKLVVECLNSFDGNRVDSLQRLADWKPSPEFKEVKEKGKVRRVEVVKEASPEAMFAPMLRASSEVERVEGLRMAKVLAKPVTSRTQWETDWVDSSYPLLNAGTPVEELRPRSGTLAKLMSESQTMREKLLAGSQESATRIERCLSLPEDKQPKEGCK